MGKYKIAYYLEFFFFLSFFLLIPKLFHYGNKLLFQVCNMSIHEKKFIFLITKTCTENNTWGIFPIYLIHRKTFSKPLYS